MEGLNRGSVFCGRLRLRKVSSLGLEAVLVCHVRHRVNNPICPRVRELPPHRDRFVLRTRVLELPLFLLRNPIARFVSASQNITFRLKLKKYGTYAKLYPSIPMFSFSYLRTWASASLPWGAARATATRAARATT